MLFKTIALAASLLLPLAARAAPLQPLAPEQFNACVQSLAEQTGTAQKPITRDDFLRIAGTAQYDDRVRQSMLVTTAEPTYWWDELAATTDEQRVQEGRAVLEREREALTRIEQRFGVPKEIIVAIYGIETNYGPARGKIPVLDAALSVACLRPCSNPAGNCLARERAYAAVRLLRDGRVRPEEYHGSWAAAFGRTQFEPDTFEQLAVDFDGDGISDIVGSEQDAWATTANHLARRGGWTMGAPVYVEVRVPPAQQAAFSNSGGDTVRQRDDKRKVSAWAAAGWQRVGPNGEVLPLQVAGDPEAYPWAPVGLPGPMFLVTRNFQTIWRYNNSERYALEVAVLADKITGGPGIVTPWPTDDPGLTRAQVRELQQALNQRGYTQVVADGVVGRNTRDAIEAERAKKGLPPGRRVGQRTLPLLIAP